MTTMPVTHTLITASARWQEAVRAEEALRRERDIAIYEDHRMGVRQRDIVAATGLTRETIRRIIDREEDLHSGGQ